MTALWLVRVTRDFGVQGKTKHISILAGGCAAIAYVAFLAPASALAQEAGTTVLQTITVDGAKNQDPKAPVKGYVAKTSASATKTGRSLIETPQSVSVISRDRMDAQDVRNLGEALKLPTQHAHLRSVLEEHLEPLGDEKAA